MSLPNKDEVEGKLEQAKGKVKSAVGNWTGDKELEAEGEADNIAGEAQEGWGSFKRGVGEAIEDLGDAVKR
jgi:Uncharacterized protein conserved in bacteria